MTLKVWREVELLILKFKTKCIRDRINKYVM